MALNWTPGTAWYQCVTVPKILNDTDTDTFFRYQIFLMMIVVEPVLKVSTVVVKIRRASLRQICQQEAGSPGGKRRAATSIGNDLPYPVGTAPNRCCRSSGSVAAQIRSALIKRGVNNQSDMLLEPESRATLMGGQDDQLSAEHICLSQCVSSSRSPPFSQLSGSEIGWEFCQW